MNEDNMHPQDKNSHWKKMREELSPSFDEEMEQEAETTAAAASEAGKICTECATLKTQLEQLDTEAKAHLEKALRAAAELENVRRRADREVSNARLFGAESLVKALLPVLDSLEQAQQAAAGAEVAAMSEGLALTLKLLQEVLQKQDVIVLDPIGQTFNPEEHEAMVMQEQPGTPPNVVITVFQKGYKMHGRVLRPARVIVSK
ncbi:MAG: nucleotide exchange factor GrpE [Legionellaceae bacterium]|nr:nucleotide exchange factor GrpE [Legionellaceae bacterium]